jgi:hypothetical protein
VSSLNLDVKQLLEWLGPSGLEKGLEYSNLTVAELREIAENLGAKVPARSNRSHLAHLIATASSKVIDKSTDELLSMCYDDLFRYFEDVKPSRQEVMKILTELDFDPGSEAKKSLYKYAARQISETGLFKRVAGQADVRSDT